MTILYRKNSKTIIRNVNKKAENLRDLTDDELKKLFNDQRQIVNLSSNKYNALNVIEDTAFSIVKEGARRVLGLDAFPVQIQGAYYLNKGDIIEMKTGEGKTFTATFSAILNSLAGNVHIVTVNEYLAKRDSVDMGRLYNFFGISTSYVLNSMNEKQKREAFTKDIVYLTASELGFTYLYDNMKYKMEDKILGSLDYCIIDEVDSVLIDEGRTPLIISGTKSADASIYNIINLFAKSSLVKGKEKEIKIEGDELFSKQASGDLTDEDIQELGDFTIDYKHQSITLTDRGIDKLEKFFGKKINEDPAYLFYVENSLRANYLLKKDVDYIVKDGDIQLVDDKTGRVMDGRQFSNGLHQALQAKENLKITNENITVASITIQSLFRLFKKLSGMTGTVGAERIEIEDTYNVKVRRLETNKKMIRKDNPDVLFKTDSEKYNYLIDLINKHNEKGQPILLGTTSIEESEHISEILSQKEIKHTVLNAKNEEKESKIVSQAGRLSAITIATNMAGRGTDILLGGNPSTMSLVKMKEEGYSDEELFQAQSYEVEEKYLKAKERYDELYKEYKEKCDKEKEKVIEVGGLCVVGVNKQEARRVEDQLRGRAGRQGDPGESTFLASFEDDAYKDLLDWDKAKNMKTLGDPGYKSSWNSFAARYIIGLQMQIENKHKEQREELIKYDEVVSAYRNQFYQIRDTLLTDDFKGFNDIIKKSLLSKEEIEKIRGYIDSLRDKEDKKEELDVIKREVLSKLDSAYIDFMKGSEQLRDISNISQYGDTQPIDLFKNRIKLLYQETVYVSLLSLAGYVDKNKKVNIEV